MKNLFGRIAVSVVFSITLLSSVKAQPLSATQSQANLFCNGVCNGTASVVASGGTAPYTYSWSPSGGTGSIATSLCAGGYSCTITDNVGASIVKIFTLTQPAFLSSAPGPITFVTCNGGTNGGATVVAVGGAGGYSYLWTPGGATAATIINRPAGSYSCKITDANGCNVIQNVTIPEPPAITSNINFITNVVCNGGNNGAASIIANGGTGGFIYNWTPGNPPGDGTVHVTNLTPGTYTCTITDNSGCNKTQNAIITEPPIITSSVITNNAACANINNGSAVISAGGGQGTFSYSWSPSGGTAASAFNLAAGSYTVTITDIASCIKTQSVTIASIAGSQTGELAGVAGGVAASSTQPVNGASGYYTDGACNRIARVQSSGASPVAGNVEAKVWIENSLPTHIGSPYVARHFEITPSINASTSTGTVTLYFLQSEFDAFNAVAANKLPTGPTDATGIANLRVGKYSGTSSDNSGLPSSYSSVKDVINPNDAGIIWNATDARWEVTFDVSGFSGFVAQTSQFTLPVTWASFTAEKIDDKVLLKWKTTNEINSGHFIVEYSSDGHNFAPLNTLSAGGSSSALRSYETTVDLPKSRNNYFRIQQVGRDGSSSFSVVRTIVLNTGPGVFSIITNPLRSGKLQVQFESDGIAVIYNALGKLVSRQQVSSGVQSLDVSRLSAGVYLLQMRGETKKFTVQ